nr:unnamed protein product [Digitaria exilis]
MTSGQARQQPDQAMLVAEPSRKETALSSPGNEALSAAIRASRRGCGNGRGVSGEKRREREAVVMAVAEVVRGRERWEIELSYINRRERCSYGCHRNRPMLTLSLSLSMGFLYGSLRSSYGGLFAKGVAWSAAPGRLPNKWHLHGSVDTWVALTSGVPPNAIRGLISERLPLGVGLGMKPKARGGYGWSLFDPLQCSAINGRSRAADQLDSRAKRFPRHMFNLHGTHERLDGER